MQDIDVITNKHIFIHCICYYEKKVLHFFPSELLNFRLPKLTNYTAFLEISSQIVINSKIVIDMKYYSLKDVSIENNIPFPKM